MEGLENRTETKIEFKNDVDAMNKLIYFIINKILENYEVIKEAVNERGNTNGG